MKLKNNFPDEGKKTRFLSTMLCPNRWMRRFSVYESSVFFLLVAKSFWSAIKVHSVDFRSKSCALTIRSRSSLIADAQFDGVHKIDGKSVNAVWWFYFPTWLISNTRSFLRTTHQLHSCCCCCRVIEVLFFCCCCCWQSVCIRLHFSHSVSLDSNEILIVCRLNH